MGRTENMGTGLPGHLVDLRYCCYTCLWAYRRPGALSTEQIICRADWAFDANEQHDLPRVPGSHVCREYRLEE